MSMLAERRRKTKWTLNPGRRALWNKDDSCGIKFGRGLMEKMGWKVGQGLGVNEQGIKEPLKISVKSDSKGMGYKDNDNEWIQQQHEFNELLGKLSSTKGSADKDTSSVDQMEKVRTSLEEKSKHSKTRVHYHKFTRGKDLSKYSEKDLECILGRKKESLGNELKESADSDSQEQDTSTQIINGGSMVDYFTQKMQERANARSMNSLNFDHGEASTLKEYANDLQEPEEMNVVKKKKKKKGNYTEPCDSVMDNSNVDKVSEDLPCAESSNGLKETVDDTQEVSNEREDLTAVRVKNSNDYSNDENKRKDNVNFVSDEAPTKKKKKRKKEKEVEECNIHSVKQLENEDVTSRKKKKVNEESVHYSDEALSPQKKSKAKKEIDNIIITDSENHIRKEEDGTEWTGDAIESIFHSERKIKKCKSKGDRLTKEPTESPPTEESCHAGTGERREKEEGKKKNNKSKSTGTACPVGVVVFQGANLGKIKGYGCLKSVGR